ncbi:alcohol dehydrogenase catalytic domain-containing protein [Roseomonas sp. CCTCC AB2023176]|uniref:alcohol dehydrogenase catalytic domain-containing protein n=1 Tax=Roseomonas sp. CCTCC AB2023176 TaxID=3342640 RepID=UPI0035DCC245
MLEEQPGLARDLAWLALAAERLPAVLTGAAEPPPLPEETGGLERLAQVLADAAGTVAAGWPAERPLRVLDFGGPALARHLAVALARSGRRVLHARPGGGHGAALGGSVEPVPLDWNPAGAGAPPFVADLVVGLLPATRAGLGTAILPGLLPALAEGGTLLLVEALPGRVMEFAAGGEAPPGAGAWREALAADGWTAIQALALDSGPWPALMLAARHAGTPGTAEPVPPRAVLVADAGAAPLAAALSDLLRGRGTATDVARLEDAAGIAPKTLRGVPVLALAAPSPAALPTTLAGIARLAEAARGVAERLVIVAQGDAAAAAAEAVRGLGRVLANEMPDLPTRRVLVDAALTPRRAAARLLPSLFTPKGDEAERVLGLGACRVPRLVAGLAPPVPGASRLSLHGSIGIGHLGWEPLPDLPPPGPGEVRVRVEAAGLNFRDLMWAQGLLPEETLRDGFAGPGLGMEFAGVVEEAAAGTPFRPGARVFGFAPRALATRTVTRAEAISPIPEGLSFAAAATIPVAFLTAVYSLETLARLGPGSAC